MRCESGCDGGVCSALCEGTLWLEGLRFKGRVMGCGVRARVTMSIAITETSRDGLRCREQD
eukprot:3513880-Rhodomonas_salina.1